MPIKTQQSNQCVPVDHLSFYPLEMKHGAHNEEAYFLASQEFKEMMLYSTASTTEPGKVEADVLLTFQIISLILIWARPSKGSAWFRFVGIAGNGSRTRTLEARIWSEKLSKLQKQAFPCSPFSQRFFFFRVPFTRFHRVVHVSVCSSWMNCRHLNGRQYFIDLDFDLKKMEGGLFTVTTGPSCWHTWSVPFYLSPCGDDTSPLSTASTGNYFCIPPQTDLSFELLND